MLRGERMVPHGSKLKPVLDAQKSSHHIASYENEYQLLEGHPPQDRLNELRRLPFPISLQLMLLQSAR